MTPKHVYPRLIVFGASIALTLFGLALTVQTFAPRMAQVLTETDHLPALGLGAVGTAALVYVLRALLD